MKIGLHDTELTHFKKTKTFPNLAIMKLASYHKSKGDTVEWWSPFGVYDLVYSSKVFTFSKPNDYLPESTIKGGTGYDIHSTLPPEIDSYYPDYSLYPACDYAVGFTTRGCINHCDFCIVPLKEGFIHPYSTWQEIVRPDTNKLVLLDNNILASDHGRKQLIELAQSPHSIDLNQGMDITLVDEEVCHLLKQIKWIKYMRFSCDRSAQIPHFERLNNLLQRFGIPSSKIFIYMLIRDDLREAEDRVRTLYQLNPCFALYAQAEHKIDNSVNPMAKQFARFVYARTYKKATWADFVNRYIKKAS